MLQSLLQSKEMGSMRGLTMFISDIRSSQNKETEQKRVEKELAHIRKQFADKSIDGYNLKKYVWKLLYMYMLGYDIEVGHMEALKLITSPKFSEKNAGYIACAMLWNENTEFLKLLVQSVRKDLMPVDEINQSLALTFVGNIGGQEFADSLSLDVQKIVVSQASRSYVRKKAALCLLRLIRKSPDCLPQDDFPQKLQQILDDPNYGIVLAIVTLMVGMASHSTVGLEEAPAKAIYLLNKLVFAKDKKNSVYKYYLTLCPWLQVKLLKLLQYFPPPSDPNTLGRLHLVLNEILTKTVMTKNENKNNADHSIMFESINTIINMSQHGVRELMPPAINILSKFIGIKEPNYKYLGLETMTKLANVPGTLPHIRKHHEIILQSLQDGDISIRKRALDLIYVACDKSNANEIVSALVSYLQTAHFEIREELVLKIAILAEKFATDLRWYIDVVLQLISIAGDFVSDEVWYRVVQIITNNEDLQEYAAVKCYHFLQNPMVHENGVKVAAYVLGEFADQIRANDITGQLIFSSLHSKFITSSDTTKALLLSSYIKLCNNYPEIKGSTLNVFQQYRSNIDTEIQQRACEYSSLLSLKSNVDLVEKVFDVMPKFTERQSLLEKRLKKQKYTTDRDVWNEGEKKSGGEGRTGKGSNDDDDEDEEDDDEEDDEEDEEEDEDDDDDDDDGKEGEPAKRGVSSPPKTMDIIGGFDLSSSNSNGDVAAFPPQNDKLIVPLHGKDSGVVYESSELQIGMKLTMENNNSAKFVFFYGNRSPFSLKDLTVALPESDAFRLQVRPVEPFEVPPKKQIQQFYLFHCFKPFKGPVSITLNFKYQNQSKSLSLSLPLLLTRFVVPTQIDPSGFVGAWQKYQNEIQVTRKLDRVDVAALQETVTTSLRMFVVSGVEKTNENFSSAGIFHTMTKGANGQNVTMPCLLRIETKPNVTVIRVTVHSGHQSVSDALINAVTKALGANEA